MKTYVIYKTLANGKEMYLQPDKRFAYSLENAKRYPVKWWIDLLMIIIEILRLFGGNKEIKYKQL